MFKTSLFENTLWLLLDFSHLAKGVAKGGVNDHEEGERRQGAQLRLPGVCFLAHRVVASSQPLPRAQGQHHLRGGGDAAWQREMARRNKSVNNTQTT